MITYIILAWLPGSSTFLAKNPEGTLGILTPQGFDCKPETVLKANKLIYGFVAIPERTIKASQLYTVKQELDKKLPVYSGGLNKNC